MAKTRKNRKGKRSKRNKYIMKGCSRKRSRMLGGSFYKPASPVPAPLVGQPWTYDKWPGSGGITGNRNYFPLDEYIVDPQTRMHIRGGTVNGSGSLEGDSYTPSGAKSLKTRGGYKYKGKKGGAAGLTTGISNLLSEARYNMSTFNDELYGNPAGPNPLPYKQPSINSNAQIII